MFFPPPRPKEPPIEWTDLHEAALVILDREVKMEPDAFVEWLEARPGAAAIYLMVAEGEGIVNQIVQELQAMQMPEGEMPATLAEMMDEQGRIPPLRWSPPPRDDIGPGIAEHQWRLLSGVRHAATHPKGR